MTITGDLKIVRLDRLWHDDRPICDHAFSLIIDGRMTQDDPACACGGQRLTLIAVSGSDGRDGAALDASEQIVLQ
ncbi:MAG TPA: hypothetical protein VM870_02975 [Pyrinomonadaceae bacterium]|jgi:hypothetical protein|nr:hypothetical protein [Pyrinomonadaceae bacterium]